MKKYFVLFIASMLSIAFVACKKEKTPGPVSPTTPAPTLAPYKLTYVSTSGSNTNIEIKNFVHIQTITATRSTDGATYYSFKYSFEIHNKTNSDIVWGTNYTLQNYIIKGSTSYGAGGAQYATTIPANGLITVRYSGNSSVTSDSGNLDDAQLKIIIHNGNTTSPVAALLFNIDPI